LTETVGGTLVQTVPTSKYSVIGSHVNLSGSIMEVSLDNFRVFDFDLSSSQRTELVASSESPLGVTVDGTPSATVSGLTEDTQYTFKVYPINGAGQAGDAVTEVANTLTSAPTLSSVVQGSGTSLQLTWTAPTSGTADSYTIQRSPSGCASMSSIATGEAGLTYTDSTPQSATEYCYQVLSLNEGGSIASNQVSQTSGASGGSGGGGGGSSTKTIDQVISSAFDLSLFQNHHFVKLGDILDNESLSVNWNTEKNVQVSKIEIGENSFTSKGGIIGLPVTPFTLLGDASGESSGEIKYTVTVPATPCTELTTSNCMSIDKHTIPVTVTLVHNGETSVITEHITVEIISDFDLALIVVLLAVALPVMGYLMRKRGKGHHGKRKTASSILNTHPKKSK
jgi:hypothetical protein